MTDVSSIAKVRNILVYVLILIAITLTAMSLLSYFYVFSFLLWLLVIALFFGTLGIILKLSNKIFDINNPNYVDPTNDKSSDPEVVEISKSKEV